MNYDVSNENLAIKRQEFDGCHEIPIDIDFSLPDYCPDIQKILKCQVIPNINTRNISGDRLNIEGTANIRIIYLDSENNRIRSCENSVPFSASIDIKSTPENAISQTHTRVEYMNCRAVSPRKIDIHGALSLCAKIYCKDTQKVSCCISGKDIQQKIENATCSNLVGIGQQQFSVNESFEPGENKPSPEIIIRSDTSLILNDYKTLPNKVVVKGEAVIKILYIDDISTGNLENMEYTIPISQIVDVPGADEKNRYIITGEILSHNEQIRSENDNDKGFIDTEMKIAATVMAYTDKELGVVSDVYSTEYDITSEKESLSLNKLVDIINESFNYKGNVEISGTNISKIIDIWSDSCSANTSFKNDKIEIKGKINICILAYDSENIPLYLERIMEFNREKETNANNKNTTAEIFLVPTSIEYSQPKGNSVDMKIDFEIYGALYNSQNHNMVVSAQADESHPADKDKNASLTIYYASESEPLWDIAKKYYTSVNSIKDENNLTEDITQQNGMILIPVK